MIKKLLFSLVLLLPLATQARPLADCNNQIPYGIPQGNTVNSTVVCKTAYIFAHDNVAKIPKWVAYVLTPEHAVGCIQRMDSFAPEYAIPFGQRAELKDYAKSGYDIGHQAPSGDMQWDLVTEKESFSLGNMAPQLPGFNRGIWKKLEDQIRGWTISRNNSLLIYVGPIYSNEDNTIGFNRVVIPHAFYKVVIDTVTNEVMAFEFIHEASQGKLTAFISTLDQVQKDTGIVFPVPVNAIISSKIWNITNKNARIAKRAACFE